MSNHFEQITSWPSWEIRLCWEDASLAVSRPSQELDFLVFHSNVVCRLFSGSCLLFKHQKPPVWLLNSTGGLITDRI